MMSKYLQLFKRIEDQRGMAAALVAAMMMLFLGIAALAIDLSYVMVVRNELQNAADAAALAGARVLYPNTPPKSPNWTAAQTEAEAAIGLNKSSGITLSDCQAETGYWNLTRTPFGLQGQGITPGANDAPAVEVTVSRSPGNNGGPLRLFIAPVIGTNFASVSAQAVAVVQSPGTANAGRLLPMVISKEAADQAGTYNSAANKIRIGSAYHYPNSMAGQWTSFELNTNNVPTVRDLIQNGNPTTLKIGDHIWIEPGTKNTLYDNSHQPSMSWYVGKDVVFAVVNAVLSDVTHSSVPIYAFIGFHITDSVGGNGKYVEGYFKGGIFGGLGPSGPNYGLYTPPKLVY
jgi:Flp pilus assembly protein TadG